jgi:ribosomal protein S18 acetylase RimI-like enzyme
MTQLNRRRIEHEDDYWRIRAFLREVMLLNDRQHLSWPVARLDYWRWHVVLNCEACPSVEGVTTLWETPTGQIVAVLNPEGMGEAHLQVHPHLVTAELAEEMIAVAEEELVRTGEDGQRKLGVWIHQYDRLQQEVTARLGYARGKWPEHHHRRSLDGPLPEARPAPGYTVRPLGDPDELPARSWASWRAFHPDEPDEAYEGWEWYHNIQRHPLYRRDLDIVAVAPDGTIAGFTTLWYDDVTRDGYFEPVGVMPEHHRRGLGKAVMVEAMRRIEAMGGTLVTVGGYSEAANALYSSVMSPEYLLIEPWEKVW